MFSSFRIMFVTFVICVAALSTILDLRTITTALEYFVSSNDNQTHDRRAFRRDFIYGHDAAVPILRINEKVTIIINI